MWLAVTVGLLAGCLGPGPGSLHLRYSFVEAGARRSTGPATFRAGAARVDITPPPGYSTGAYGPSAAFARGFWTRLYARTIFLEDAKGNRLALVSCDLFAMPGGLVDRVAEILAASDSLERLGRDQLLVAATHTHHGPGNFTTAKIYNFGGSKITGFDPDLFEFLAQQIARSIHRARRNAVPATAELGTTPRVANLVRNRAMNAFRLNPEAEGIINEGSALPVGDLLDGLLVPEAYKAVLPELTTLRLKRTDNNKQTIAIAAFFAVHPTVLRHTTELYTADLFGVATRVAEQSLEGEGSAAGEPAGNPSAPGPVVALFNGAEGDVQPQWVHRDRREALELGERLAAAIVAPAAARNIANPALEHAFAQADIADVCLVPPRWNVDQRERNPLARCTADRPLTGVATAGGALDGYTVLHDAGWTEGVKGGRKNRDEFGDQGVKQPSFDPGILPFDLPFSLTGLFLKDGDVAETALLGVYRIGPLVLATLPGEFTTVMGKRIRDSIESALPERVTEPHVVTIGLANEYISYFVTREEYEYQGYEASSTLYGPMSGPVVQSALTALASRLGSHHPEGKPTTYEPGGTQRFSLDDAGEPPVFPDDALDHIVQNPISGKPARDYPTACWYDERRDLRNVMRGARDASIGLGAELPRVVPDVRIGTVDAAGIWSALDPSHASDDGLQIVTVATRTSETEALWCAIWLPPENIDPTRPDIAMRVDRLGRSPRELICGPTRGEQLGATICG